MQCERKAPRYFSTNPEIIDMRHYDCVVIGTGPAGQKGAIQAAKLWKRVAIIEKNRVLGCSN